jgi:hypothetical protein
MIGGAPLGVSSTVFQPDCLTAAARRAAFARWTKLTRAPGAA